MSAEHAPSEARITTMTQATANRSLAATDVARGAERASIGALLSAAALALAFIALFHRWFLVQNRFSLQFPDDWGHAFIVPFISGYAIWKQRAALARFTPEVFWPGALLFFLGVICYFYFTTGVPNHMLQGWAIVLTLYGLVALLLGPRFMLPLTFPIAYLLFGVTISEKIMLKVTFELQLIASKGAWAVLNMVGLPTDLSGNVLAITRGDGSIIPLEVAKACSGMRTVVAFYALGTAVAFLSCRLWWQRVALLLLAGPIAIFINVLRVASLGVASVVNPNLAAGETHMFIGVLWLVPALGVFMAAVWALRKASGEAGRSGAPV